MKILMMKKVMSCVSKVNKKNTLLKESVGTNTIIMEITQKRN